MESIKDKENIEEFLDPIYMGKSHKTLSDEELEF